MNMISMGTASAASESAISSLQKQTTLMEVFVRLVLILIAISMLMLVSALMRMGMEMLVNARSKAAI